MKLRLSGEIHYIIILYILIAGCAKVGSPSGGPRDRLAPVVVKSEPGNGARNYRGKEIIITFNEYVVLDQINEKFIVSPPLAEKPEVSLKGKSIVVRSDEDLRDNTTYTFNFQDAIKDLNEGNKLENFQFVLSTGDFIDSLTVAGSIVNAYDLGIPENTLILLYSNLADSAVTGSLPDYISRADKNGMFLIQNVHAGKYRLYALKDADNSKNFNLIDEEFAFLENPVEALIPAWDAEGPADSISVPGEAENKLVLFRHEKKMRYLNSSSRNMPYQLIYTLSLPPDTLGFDFSIPGTDPELYLTEKSRDRDTVRIWLKDSLLYSQPQISTLVTYPFSDTTGDVILKRDTLIMRFIKPRSSREESGRQVFRVSGNMSGASLRPGQKIYFESQTPFRAPDTSKIFIFRLINDSLRIKVPYTMVTDTTNSRRIIMSADLAPGQNYLFIADSSAFGDIYGEHSDSTGTRISMRNAESFGSLAVNLKNYTGYCIIQLLDGSEKPVIEQYTKSEGSVKFLFLNKGIYRMRAIFDLNGDRRWTTGDFSTGRQPEPVSFFPGEIEIKENWDLEQDWDLSDMNVKVVTK